MKKDFKFSIILSIYNVEQYLNEAIDSLLNQTLNFEDNVQLILVNDGSTDNSEKICLEYQEKYPDNIKTITKENGGLSSARNCGLNHVEGEYVNFFDPDDILSENTLKHVYEFFKKHEDEIDFVAIPLVFFGNKEGDHILNYKFENEGVLDLTKNPEFIHLSSASAFFKKDVITRYTFDDGLARGEDALTINKLLLEKKKYGVVNGVTYWYRQRFDKTSMLGSAKFKRSNYTPLIKDYFLNLIKYCIDVEGYIPDFIQYALIYDFQWLAGLPEIPEFFDEEDTKEFWDAIYEFLSYIDDDIIKNHIKLPEHLKSFLLFLKNKKDFNIKVNDNKVTFHTGNHQIAKLNNHKLWFDIITLRDGYLHLSAYFKSLCDVKNLNIEAITKEFGKNSEKSYVGNFFEYPNRKVKRYLSIDWLFTYTAEFKIPIDSNDITRTYFRVKYFDNDNLATFSGNIKFARTCHLSDYNHYSINDNQIVSFQHNSIYCKPNTFIRHFKNELVTFALLFKKRPISFLSGVLFRIIRIIAYPLFMNKKIWLFADRPDIADDNAKHLFSYAVSQSDNEINKYYVIKKDSPDFKKMKKIDKHIIPFGSLKHKLYYSFAEKVISPFLNENYLNPFSEFIRLYCGYFSHKDYFLQHGVTKDDISANVKRYNKDLSLILTTSEYERNSFLEYDYNYEEDIIQVLGFPRFDNLKNESIKKRILFMPTWRSYIKDKDSLINSEYYELINSFLNNEKLNQYLSKYDYKLVFKPHPELLQYLKEGLFEVNENIIISIDDSYQDLFNYSTLLITDYSSVFFDFAYLKKPVIYYQVNSEFYHYEKGYFDYQTMGFGKVTDNEEDLVDRICEYFENGFENEEKFNKRVEKFFKYTDQNNSKRVYDWILKH